MKKTTKKSVARFTVGFKNNYETLNASLVTQIARRVGGFIETIGSDGEITYVVDFNLGGGLFRGLTLEQIIDDPSGIESLKWIINSNFPMEIREYIVKLFRKKKLIDKHTMNDTLEQLRSSVEDGEHKNWRNK